MAKHSKISNSDKHSSESKDLLDKMKNYLRIEHQEHDDDLLKYIRKQARLNL
jgi:hypothetical protein